MKQKLAILNIILPVLGLLAIILVELPVLLIPEWVILVLVILTLGRAFLLFQQQVVFAYLPMLIIALPSDYVFGFDIFAAWVPQVALLYLWLVNLQYGQRPWHHPIYCMNWALLILFFVLGIGLLPLPDLLLKFGELQYQWAFWLLVAVPLFLPKLWARLGRIAAYWTLLAIMGLVFELADTAYLIFWMTLSSLLSLTIDSYVMAYIDELTGIMGRRALIFRMKTAASRYTVVMVDVDHFKQFNDKHGHQIGDDVLRTVAMIISKTHGATAYRYGGEEFTLLFSKGDSMELAPYVESTRIKLEKYNFYPKGQERNSKLRGEVTKPPPLKITASFGMAQHRSGEKPEDVLERADQALYSAKGSGRNKVVIIKS